MAETAPVRFSWCEPEVLGMLEQLAAHARAHARNEHRGAHCCPLAERAPLRAQQMCNQASAPLGEVGRRCTASEAVVAFGVGGAWVRDRW